MLYIFSIETSYLCDNPDSEWASLPSADSYVIVRLHAIADGIYVPYDDKTYILCHCLCTFSWVLSSLMYVPDHPVSASPDFIILYTM